MIVPEGPYKRHFEQPMPHYVNENYTSITVYNDHHGRFISH